jgi:hypothetical protein
MTRAGVYALVRRHGAVTRLRAFIAGRRRRVIDPGASAPMGNAIVRDVWCSSWRYHDGPMAPEVMVALGTIPRDDLAATQVFTMRMPATGRVREYLDVGVPVADDLDADGVCRCGCGYSAPGP